MSIKGRIFVAAIGATALLGAGTAAAQEAGDMVVGAGLLSFYPQDSSKPLTFTSPVHREVPGSGSSVSNAHTLGLSFLYYFSSQWAMEAVIGVPPKFKLEGEGSLANVGRIGEASQYSPTLLARYTFLDNSSKFRPFVGIGGTYVWYDDIKLSNNLQNTLGGSVGAAPGTTRTSAKLDASFAPVFNAGASYAIDRKWSVSLSLSYVMLKTKAKLTTRSVASGATVATSESKLTLDPIVSYLSLNYKF